MTPTLNIILRLMHERAQGEASPFAAYINAIYEAVPDNPIFWSEEVRIEKKRTIACSDNLLLKH